MNELVELLAGCGGRLALGATLVMGLAALALLGCSAPVHRQRLGELGLGATVLWLVLAWIPVPRPVVAELGSTAWPDRAQPEVASAPQPGPPPPGRPLIAPQPDSARERTLPGAVHQAEPSAVRSSARSPARSPAQVDWRARLVVLYLIGVAGFLVWQALGGLALVYAGRAATEPEPWLASLYASLPLPVPARRARLRISPRCRRPVVHGLRRPGIMLPKSWCTPQKATSLRHVLLHESVHVWRGDAWGHFLFHLACPLLYFHPLYWWLRAQVQFARELIADDWAARFDGKQSYVEQLIALVREDRRLVPGWPGVLGVFRLRTQFYRRMKMLIDRKHGLLTKPSAKWRVIVVSASAVVVAVMACLVGITPAAGDHEVAASTAEAANVSAAAAPSQPEITLPPAETGAQRASTITVNCQIVLKDDLVVAAQSEGQLVEVAAREGLPVKAGRVLARLDEEMARLQVEMARANLEAVKAEEYALEEAQVELMRAEHRLQRVKALNKEKAISEEERSLAKLDYDVARCRAARAQQQLKAALELRKLEIQAAENELKRRRVAAPFNGIVVEMQRRVGEWVKPGDPICRIVRLDHLRVQGMLDTKKHDPAAVHGREVVVEALLPRGKKERVEGKITFVPPVLGPDGFCQFWAEIENPNRDGRWVLRPGLRATVTIRTQ